MSFQLPVYHAPDFSHLTGAPDARFAPAPKDGVAPVGFHSTSMYPESRTAAYARATAL